jgi:hypothetical protein
LNSWAIFSSDYFVYLMIFAKFGKSALPGNGTALPGNGTALLGNGTALLGNGTALLGNITGHYF